MAEIAHSFTSVPSLKSHTGDNNWTDISDATIGDAIFTSGDTYLIVATAQVRGTAINNQYGIKVQHGTTDFAASEAQVDPASSAVHYFNYTWFTTWTAVASEGIKFQFQTTDSSTDTVEADMLGLFSMNLSNDLTKDTDWHFDENSSTSTVNNTYTGDPTDSAITFTPGTADDDWLVMGSVRIENLVGNTNYLTALDRAGEATSTLPEVSQEGEATGEFILFPVLRTFALGAAENVFRPVTRNDGAGAVRQRTHNSIFALNLDKFSDQTNIYSEVSTLLNGTDFADEIQSTPYAPSATGNIWAGGYWRSDSVAGQYLKGRMQIDNADMPPGQTTAAYELNDAADTSDQWAVVHQAVINLDTSTHTVDLDGSSEDLTNVWALERSIFAVSMELAAATSSQTTRDLGETFPFSDDLARNFWGDRLGADIRDVFTFSDSFTADLILIRELSDTVATFADQLNKDAIYIRTPQDSVSFVDDLARDLINIRELQDTSTFSDALDALLINIRELQDSFTFSDDLARDQDLVRLVQDTLTLVENLDRTNTGDSDTVADHHRFKLWQNLRRWRLYKPRDQIH